MPRYTKNNRRKAINTVNRLNGLETLSPRIVLSGMVNFGPARAEAIPATEEAAGETHVTRHEISVLRNTDLSSFAGDGCTSDRTPQFRPVNQGDPNEPAPVAEAHNHFSPSDIPEDMRSTDEVFGGRDFWVMGSRPFDHVSQLVSGPGAEPNFPGLNDLLAFDPASLLAPSPMGGAPASNLESIFSQIPSLSDVANDGDGGFWDWVKGLFSGDEEEETPPEPETPPKDDWEDVHAPLWSPSVVKAEAEFWNAGMSKTSGGLSTLTTHLEKRDK